MAEHSTRSLDADDAANESTKRLRALRVRAQPPVVCAYAQMLPGFRKVGAAPAAKAAFAARTVAAPAGSSDDSEDDSSSEEENAFPVAARRAEPGPAAAPAARPASALPAPAAVPVLAQPFKRAAPAPAPAPAAAYESTPPTSEDESDAAAPSEEFSRRPNPSPSPPPSTPPLGRDGFALSLAERVAQEWAFQEAMYPDGVTSEEQASHDPPPPPGTHLDRYGFVVEGAPPPPDKAELDKEAQRLSKWVAMGVCSSDRSQFARLLAGSRERVKDRLRGGIPHELRGVVWQRLSGSRELMLRNRDYYSALVGPDSPSIEYEVDIIKDLSRTFPSHNRFRLRGGMGQKSLFNVLKAWSLYDDKTGYVQGMAFIAAIFLMHMPEEEAFWMFVALMKGAGDCEPLEGLFQEGLPLLQQCQFCLSGLLSSEAPKLAAHLQQQGVSEGMYATPWLITLFCNALPHDAVLRIWDILLLEGMKVVFRVSVTLLKRREEALLKLELEELVPALKAAPEAGRASADELIRQACELKVSKRLGELEKGWAAQEKSVQHLAVKRRGLF